MSTAQAWETAAMSRVKRLLPLKRYLRRGDPIEVREPTAEERAVVEAAAAHWMGRLPGGVTDGQP